MYTITKEFTFDAAHQLYGLPEGHKCGRLHGHTYTVIVELQSAELDEHGFVKDYGELSLIKDFIDGNLDHRNLNDVLGIKNTTAENIARFIYHEFMWDFPEISAITVKETSKTAARYEPS